jgi:hypothetical protein
MPATIFASAAAGIPFRAAARTSQWFVVLMVVN